MPLPDASPKPTGKISFRPFTQGDIRAVAEIVGDPAVMRYSDSGAVPFNDVPGWIGAQNEPHAHGKLPGGDDQGLGRWAVVETARDRVVGYLTVSRHQGRTGKDEAEIGFRFAVAYWGKGFATEAAKAGIAHGLALPGITRIVGIVDPANGASIRVLEKAGMKRAGEIMLPGYDHADYVFETTRPG